MGGLTGDIEHLGWRIGVGFAGSGGFYAAYTGDVFGRPERGVLAAMARAHPPAGGQAGGAAAQIVVHELAEGYFSARPTLGPKRAVAQVLAGINDWLVAQLRHEDELAPVSLAVLLFHGSRLAVVRVGACRVFRVRGGAVTPLLHHHEAAGLAVGREAELAVEFVEESAEPGDRFVLLSGAAAPALLLREGDAGQAAAAIVAALAGEAAAMVLDVLDKPAAAGPPDLTGLPLRPAPREGEVWDGFRLGRTLYRGRYTMLKAAFDELGQREVALKIPLPAMLQDEIFTAGFMREAWIGVTARGASLARYIDVPPERRRSLYLVMPLYKGETLEARLSRAPPVTLPEGIGIILKLCEAVRDLAAIEVIHRDIKPDNVMLLPGHEVRLLDLGLAYLPGIDAAGAVKPGGTLRYMAPELIQGVQVSARSEVFALGVTMYRMFSGGLFPFGQRERVPLSRVRRDLPGWVGAVLGRALASEPARRFDDAAGLAAALREGLLASDDPPGMAAWRAEARRLRRWQAAAVVLAVGFLVLLAMALR